LAFSRAAMVNALQAELDEMRMQGRRLLAPD
jgi:hypothetical protein